MENNYLDGWIFRYNSATNNWLVCTRDQWLDMYNIPETNFLRSKEFKTLQEILIKNQGDAEKIKQLIKNK